MFLTHRLLQSSSRLWQGISATRGYHILMRTTAVTPNPIPVQPLIPATKGIVSLLAPVNAFLQQVAGFKVKGRLKHRCKDCYTVVRQGRGYVICPTHPRHKQMSMKKRDYKSWILTHATQSKERGY
ncbi:mRpL36 [Drosophila busckii]|uniref:Ribosomal protein n=1 Tax=Drosophila busckii TaxID=30019 RepID=A0A0M3QW29_DROBS|nr:39S ribosomal protein L36, mitochondrial [Drosophila busckii]XP_017843797.1 39S ribosomal protein L36, mitochondrial [Drosophila busckii]ALC43429.1 mRpL36 [Drosophila busckii]